MYLQDSLHFGKGLLRLGNTCSNCLGTVHTGTASKPDDAAAVVCLVHIKRFSDIYSGRIGDSLVVDIIGDLVLCKDSLKASS